MKKIDEKKGGPRVKFEDKNEEHEITVSMKDIIDDQFKDRVKEKIRRERLEVKTTKEQEEEDRIAEM